MSKGTTKRPKVTKITVVFDDGSQKIYSRDDGNFPVALFWGNENPGEVSGIDVLGAFYKYVKKDKKTTHAKLKAKFGKVRADAVCPDPTKDVTLTQQVIEKIWKTENPGTLPGTMSKDPDCDIGG